MGKKKVLNPSGNKKIISKVEYEMFQKREATVNRWRNNPWIYCILMCMVAVLSLVAFFFGINHGTAAADYYVATCLLSFALGTVLLCLGFYLFCYLLGAYYSSSIFRYRVVHEGETYKNLKDEQSVLKKKETEHLLTDIYNVKKYRKSWIPYSIFSSLILVGVFVINDFYYQFEKGYASGSGILEVIIRLIVQTAVFAVPCCVGYFLYCSFFILELEEEQAYAQNIKDQDEAGKNIYEYSIKMSYKYLDQYYAQTRKQAKNGFAITCGVAICGAVIIGGGVLAMYKGVTEPAYVTTATGVIVEFIASIFFYLYNKTMQNMGDYHNKLVLSQNIAIALELVNSIGQEKKDEVMADMVSELLKDINVHINENKPERKNDAVDHVKYADKQNASVNE